MHLPSFKLIWPTVLNGMHLQENTLYDKKVATCNGLREDTIKRNMMDVMDGRTKRRRTTLVPEY